VIAHELMIERIIEEMRPDLRIAIAKLLSGSGAHIFNFAKGTNSQTGVQTEMACFLTQQHVAIVMESVLGGMAEAEKFVMTKMQEAGAFGKVTQ
jgi:4-diphosphocytidyl-2C-methyl-D-erythritol kinase